MDDLLKNAIADAKAVRETALVNAKLALEEAFTPKIQSMLSKKIQSETEGAPEEGEMAPEEGGEGEGEGEDLQLMEKSIPASERKFKGRMGGTTPDHTDKAGGTDEERDPEEYAEARAKAAEERDMGIKKGTTWIGDLISRGYSAPLIKEVTPDGTQMWFSQDGIDYVAKLGALGISDIEKATFTRTKSTEDNKKQKPQETSIMNNDDDEDDERA